MDSKVLKSTTQAEGKMIKSYLVTVDQPDDVTDEQMAAYIEGAVAEMKGCRSPDDPIFEMDGDAVTCTKLVQDLKPLDTIGGSAVLTQPPLES
jgi:hypothetical protein